MNNLLRCDHSVLCAIRSISSLRFISTCCLLLFVLNASGQNAASEILDWEIHHDARKVIPDADWASFDVDDLLPEQDTFWLHVVIEKTSSSQANEILLLHGLQEVELYKKESTGAITGPAILGTSIPLSELVLPEGVIKYGRGNSAQIPLDLHLGLNHYYLRVKQPVFEKTPLLANLYTLNDWYALTTRDRSETFLMQGFIGGALLIISIYHFLIFLIRRDKPFLWYALYTALLCASMLLENGVLQSSIFTDYQYGYRILWEIQLLSFIPAMIYFLFMRSFINLEKQIPWLDRFVRRYLIVYIPLALLLDVLYIYTLKVSPLTFIFPLSILLLGLFCVIVIFKNGDRLALYFTIGSLILYLSVFSNTLISLFITLEWMSELSFPRVWITEFGVILEILIFSLGLGYRLRLQDKEKQIAVDHLRKNISSDLHDDVGTMLSGLSMQAQVLAYKASDKDKQSLHQISDISSRALDTMRDTVWAIDSRQDKFENLLDRMRNFAENMLFKSEINYNLRTEGLEKEEKVLPNIRQQLYLIYKEAITNVLKHAQATHVDISLIKSPKDIKLIIKDNGVGITTTNHSGLGLSNMEMRAKRLGGKLILESEEGLKIVIVVPL